MFSLRTIVPFISTCCLLAAAIPTSLKRAGCECSLSGVKLQLPANQTQLIIPSGQSPNFVTVGSGVQNYTCGSTGTYTSIGALATLFDVSCLAKSPLLTSIPSLVYEAEEVIPSLTKILGKTPLKLGDHLFITNPQTGSGIVPRFDFTASQNNPNMFLDAKKTGDIPAQTAPTANVDWLELTTFLGDLAQTAFRVNTKEGQPPASCTPGQTASIPYAALYWFYNS